MLKAGADHVATGENPAMRGAMQQAVNDLAGKGVVVQQMEESVEKYGAQAK